MTPADLDLAHRLAAVPGIWRAGMRVLDHRGWAWRACKPGIKYKRKLSLTSEDWRWDASPDWFTPTTGIPDLDDAATRGALLDVAREMWGRPDLHACPMFSLHTGALTGWRVAIDEHTAHYAPTEGAAIAQVILAAPR